MIEKKIHYCWFGGGAKTKMAEKCIKSWQKYFPDFEIIEWNEKNFDINMNEYTKFMYENKKFAFLSDYVRLWVVYNHGGIYFDLDVEVIKSFDDILIHNAFVGYESDSTVNTGIGFGAKAHSESIGWMIEEYDKIKSENGIIDTVNCPVFNTKALTSHGIKCDGKYQETEVITLYPIDYFNPYDNNTASFKNKTVNTHSIHWYAKSWMPTNRILLSKVTAVFHRLFGDDCFSKLRK